MSLESDTTASMQSATAGGGIELWHSGGDDLMCSSCCHFVDEDLDSVLGQNWLIGLLAQILRKAMSAALGKFVDILGSRSAASNTKCLELVM